jgi:hypothetical protein
MPLENSRSIHLCLVSDQPVPSLTPLIDPALGVKRVILLCAPDRLQYADWLKNTLLVYRIAAEILPLADAYDLTRLTSELTVLRDALPEGVSVNITGGSKLMTLAAWEVFDRPKDSIYYVRIKDDAIDWIRPKSASLYPVRDRLRIGEYLMSLGVTIRPDGLIRSKVPDVRYRLAKELLNNPNLRKQMQRFAKRLADEDFNKRNWRRSGLAFRLIEAGLLTDDSRSVNVVNNFVSGEWLEELAFTHIESIRRQDRLIHDLVRRLIVQRGARPEGLIENEIDVACLRNNTLYLIECKSGARDVIQRGQETLQKIACLHDQIGGLRGKLMLVTCTPLSQARQARAQELGIDLLVAKDMRQLSKRLTAWLQGSS